MKRKPLLIILFILVIFIILSFIYKYNLLKKIGNAELNFEKNDNFYYEIIPDENEQLSDTNLHQKLYVKDNKSVRYILNNNIVKQRYYTDTQNNSMTVVDEENKKYFVINMQAIVGNKAITGLPELYISAYSLALNEISLFDKIKIIASIKNIKVEGEDIKYIKISTWNKNVIWINKESFLLEKAEIENNIRKYIFEENNVTEREVTFSNEDMYTETNEF